MTLHHYHANSSKIATPPTLDLFENKHLQGLLSETKELLFSLSSSRSIMQSQRWIVMGIICATFIHFLMPVEPFPIADKITSLPGQPQVSFQQFAGYITVDEKQNRALFYYFFEAESQPASKPLVLWLDGGPGCSSVGAGALLEHGPFKVRGDNLVRNEYNWNKEANMLYLESPAGVGFSFSANKSFYTNVNEEITARDNLIFLQRWFAKYPKYRAKEFFITGESYAGHYVPQLAQLIVQSNLKINLKGIAEADKKELVCGEGITEKYLNRKDVQKALHAQLVGIKEWALCRDSDFLHYDEKNREISIIGVIVSLVKSGIRVFIYSGDQDAAIPFIGSRTLVNQLAKEMRLKTTVPYRAWFEGKQVGGWTQVYGKTQLSFASIRGASHTAPSTQPARSFSLFKAFLAGKPLPNA
uniref:Carboxypeptidase n=1 Tax=Quercus lobata TaxID=97700 RepID=A0A7N2M1P0_QUELO